jgi:hypothetical protein
MIKGDTSYLKHFYWMVTGGLVCGLGHPIEWLVSYGRGIGEDYDSMPEIDEFIKIASKDLHCLVHVGCDPDVIPTIKEWVDEFYHNDTQPIKRTL